MTKKTVYVIGAGASYEANLPTGDKLKGEIAKLLNFNLDPFAKTSGDGEILLALRQHAAPDRTSNTLNRYLHECRHIRANMPLAISIDNFIDTERNNEELALCGKLAIVKTILNAEKNSKLKLKNNNIYDAFNFSSVNETWYLSFFRAITENCSIQDVSFRFQDITLIIFNYDRCVEHFLLHALISYYRLTESEAAGIINNLNIIHPYGMVGSLSWLDPASQTSVAFGGELQVSQLIKYAEGIRTFTEGAHSESMKQLVISMENAERLIFLGFAFHRLNMELIGGRANGINGYENSNKIKCYATAFETSKSDQEAIRNSINYLYKNDIGIYIENTTCNQIFKDYSRSLGFS